MFPLVRVTAHNTSPTMCSSIGALCCANRAVSMPWYRRRKCLMRLRCAFGSYWGSAYGRWALPTLARASLHAASRRRALCPTSQGCSDTPLCLAKHTFWMSCVPWSAGAESTTSTRPGATPRCPEVAVGAVDQRPHPSHPNRRSRSRRARRARAPPAALVLINLPREAKTRSLTRRAQVRVPVVQPRGSRQETLLGL